MKKSLCHDCLNYAAVTVISAKGVEYTDYICTANNRETRIKSLYKCPEGYCEEEYIDILEKGQAADLLRYELEYSISECGIADAVLQM